ncbi:MAG: hypothetical protein U0V87_07895 [Acidobacteriota bacterium]
MMLSRSEAWRRLAPIEHQRPAPDPDDPDLAEPTAGSPPSYAALRLAHALYVEYDNEQHERGYYDLLRDPYELHNIVDRLPPEKRARLHHVLLTNTECDGPDACWRAQSLDR